MKGNRPTTMRPERGARRRSIRRILAVAGIAGVLVAGSATAAQAAVYTYGTESCWSGEFVVIVATYSGTGTIYWPQGSLRIDEKHSTMRTESFYTDIRTTTWEVAVSGGSLDDNGTYAKCEPELG
jgi:hypothetical protein